MATCRRVYFLRHVALSFKVLVRRFFSRRASQKPGIPPVVPLYPPSRRAANRAPTFSRMRRKWDASSRAFYAVHPPLRAARATGKKEEKNDPEVI